MRFPVKAAMVLGLLLPLLETWRRGSGYWGVEFTTMFEDYFAGGLLLLAAWMALRRHRFSALSLVTLLRERRAVDISRGDP